MAHRYLQYSSYCAGLLVLVLSITVVAASSLADLALQKVLQDASPIFGDYSASCARNAQWMSKYPDDTLIVHMNLPGTHDSATWNYTQATQDALQHITQLNGELVFPPQFYRCQERSFVDMLNEGIRVFDLRFAFDVTNSTLVFYHGAALQSETATVNDVLFGFYKWLDDHPTEAVFLSFLYEGGTAAHASDNAAVQRAIYNMLNSDAAEKYVVQTKDELGTLGEARGKLTLLRRFDLNDLPQSYEASMPGLHFPPSQWTDNPPNIELVYNPQKNLTAYIEDYYSINTPAGSSAALDIQWKYNATTAHLLQATTQHPDSLYWTFASSEYDLSFPPEYPRIMALGDGSASTPQGGVNDRLVEFFKAHKGQRMGIVMFDFFDQPSDLIDTFLNV